VNKNPIKTQPTLQKAIKRAQEKWIEKMIKKLEKIMLIDSQHGNHQSYYRQVAPITTLITQTNTSN
jgi:hypothetical protein